MGQLIEITPKAFADNAEGVRHTPKASAVTPKASAVMPKAFANNAEGVR